jgi:hypothetical protein
MKSIRRFAYATALILSALNFAPSMASAQDGVGSFTLDHEVHWQKAIVPAGKYRFRITTSGPSKILILSKISGKGAGFMLLVNDVAESGPADASRLIVVSRAGGSFVSTMEVPEFGVTLHFRVPEDTREVARTVATTTVAASR